MKKQYFIRSKGKNEFKTYHLLLLDNFSMLDVFFTSELEIKQYAAKKNLIIVDYKENFKL